MKELLPTITDEVVYRLTEESVPRIKKCLTELSDDEVWQRPNDNLVSVGNLILHLCGNVRQYVLFGLGGQPDNRERQNEFDHATIIPREQLLTNLDELMEEVKSVLSSLDISILSRDFNIQGIDITGFGILMHVVEHFSYHVGQITWYTKLLRNKDMGYYADHNLDITG